MAKPVEHVYECAECHELFVMLPEDRRQFPQDEAGRLFCSDGCAEDFEETQGYNADQARLT